MIELRLALTQAEHSLQAYDTARIDAEVLLGYVLGKNRAYLFAHLEQPLTPEQHSQYKYLIKERSQGMPIAYLIGKREFWSLSLKVTPHTLIPRHETERLVELCLELLPAQLPLHLLDLGTGSGAIALALAKERPIWQISATDYSHDALVIAKENAASLGITNINFYHSHWFRNIPPTRYHAIVSNPPYIAIADPHLSQGDLRFEPPQALISGQDGLADLEWIISQGYDYLLPQGLLLVEHGHNQKIAVQAILNKIGYDNVKSWQDLLGLDRVTGGWRLVS